MITVVLVNWNGWADTIECLQSLLNSDSAPARLVVVDNGSNDESIDVLSRWAAGDLELLPQGGKVEQYALRGKARPRLLSVVEYDEAHQSFRGLHHQIMLSQSDVPPIYVVRTGRNGGFGYGCNVGMKLGQRLGSDVFWLLNNDCVVRPETLRLAREQALRRPKTVLGTVLRYYHHPDEVQAFGGSSLSRLTGKVKTLRGSEPHRSPDYINGASMIFTAACVDDVGGFDENIFMYFEDPDFCMRAASRGYRFDVLPTDVFHKHGGSQGSRPSVKAWTQVLRNKHYVLRKNLGLGPWVLFFFGMLIVRAVFCKAGNVEGQAARNVLRSFVARPRVQ